jgi:arylsulfatase A-like enzyme
MKNYPSKEILSLLLSPLLISVLIIGLISPRVYAQGAGPNKPHVVVFMIDDLDQKTFSLLVNSGRLPNIKKHLVDRGVIFDNSFAGDSICCPSRATFFTGQYVHNHGVLDVTKGVGYLFPFDKTGQGGEQTLLPVWLQNSGYKTALFGKYMNGYGVTDGGNPARIPKGWNKWLAFYSNSTYNVYNYNYNEDGILKVGGSNESDYQTDFISRKVSAYISETSNTTPHFIYVAVTPPHTLVSENALLPGLAYGGAFNWEIPPAPRHQYLIDGNSSNDEVPSLDRSIANFNESSQSYALKPDWMQQNVPLMSTTTISWA